MTKLSLKSDSHKTILFPENDTAARHIFLVKNIEFCKAYIPFHENNLDTTVCENKTKKNNTSLLRYNPKLVTEFQAAHYLTYCGYTKHYYSNDLVMHEGHNRLGSVHDI